MTYYPPDHHETEAERLEHEHDMRLEARDKHDAYTPRCRTVGCDWPALKGEYCGQHAARIDWRNG